MDNEKLAATITRVIDAIGKLIPVYMQNEEDKSKADGNVAVCIVAPDGSVHGRVYGTDKIRGRESFRVAWIKASQVWITGMKTGDFERRVFNNELDEKKFGIRRPDFIGWLGGQPVEVDGVILSVGFSGFRGATDLELVTKAVAKFI